MSRRFAQSPTFLESDQTIRIFTYLLGETRAHSSCDNFGGIGYLIKMFQPVELPDEYLKAIGLVATRWNYLEAVLELCLIKLLGKNIMEDRSYIVFAHMAFPQRIDIFSALIAEVTRSLPSGSYLATHKQEVQSLLKTVAQDRNAIIHCRWGIREGKIVKIVLSARGTLRAC